MQKEYKTRPDWVGKVTHWDLCKRLKIDHTAEWYMHKPESVLENETQNSFGFSYTNRSPNPVHKTRPSIDQQQKKDLSPS